MDRIYTADAVILANGDYPTHPIPREILSQARYVVCCDGAARWYIDNGFTPDAIVGDGDSLPPEYRNSHSTILHYVSEQQSNDLTKAVRFLMEQGKRRIDILGATGKREDHTIGNIALLVEYARAGVDVRMYTDYGTFIPCHGEYTMQSAPGQQVSIFNFTGCELRSHGLRYDIYDFTNWWQGTLNECIGDSFTIYGKGEYLLFMNYCDTVQPEK